MSRFAADPRWLIHLPPTMSPSETSRRDDLLEHPAEAFAYYRHAGVERVVCEEKHMGSRAVVIVCRDAERRRPPLRRARRPRRRLPTPAPAALLRRPGAGGGSCSDGGRGARAPPGCGTSSRATGSASTAS